MLPTNVEPHHVNAYLKIGLKAARALRAHAACGAGIARPARIEVRPSTGSNACLTPTSNQDASEPCRALQRRST
jgi:hypothetical protein